MSKFELPKVVESKDKGSPTVYCCATCGCEWMVPALLSRFSAEPVLSFGQKPTAMAGEFEFPALVCGACNAVHSLPINASGLPKRDTDLYYKFLENMRKEPNEGNQ